MNIQKKLQKVSKSFSKNEKILIINSFTHTFSDDTGSIVVDITDSITNILQTCRDAFLNNSIKSDFVRIKDFIRIEQIKIIKKYEERVNFKPLLTDNEYSNLFKASHFRLKGISEMMDDEEK